MKALKLGLIYGFLLWLIPFVVAILIFPIRTNLRPLFESIMPVVLTGCVVFFVTLYFTKVEAGFLREGILLGVIWFAISLGLDLLLFMWGPMAMSFADYLMDIGLTYLIFPLVTIGVGSLLESRLERKVPAAQ
jgi:EamA domain-containing membrane protein RarD